ncbi:MAG: T9SS type A sorting domain-containing protein [Bacteroidetes bacterium]|nr:T9SS type A sorting domain-containing protein [Bacteroidota bacterium]
MNEALQQSWDGYAWVNYDKYLYLFDGNNNQIEELRQTWGGSAWINNRNISYTYDINNNQIEELQQKWNGSVWMNFQRFLYLYDTNNNRTEKFYQTWSNTSWVNVTKHSYTYGRVTIIDEDLTSINSYSISYNYPNPFNPGTKIKYTIPQQSFVTLKVYDLLGREITTLINEEKPPGEYEVEFIGNSANGGLPSGVYFYQLQAGNFIETKKMILAK